LPPPVRLPSDYHIYGRATERQLRFIKEAQTLGFSPQAISKLLSLTDDDQLPVPSIPG